MKDNWFYYSLSTCDGLLTSYPSKPLEMSSPAAHTVLLSSQSQEKSTGYHSTSHKDTTDSCNTVHAKAAYNAESRRKSSPGSRRPRSGSHQQKGKVGVISMNAVKVYSDREKKYCFYKVETVCGSRQAQMDVPSSGSTLELSPRKLARYARISAAIVSKSRIFLTRRPIRTSFNPSQNWSRRSPLNSSGEPRAVRMTSSAVQMLAWETRRDTRTELRFCWLQVTHAPGSPISLKCWNSHVASLQIPPASS